MNHAIKNTVTLCTLLLALCTSALADTDWTKMKRDLTIQESVFDRFFDTGEGSTTGLYIENYGVVLIARDFGHSVRVRVVHPDSTANKSTSVDFTIATSKKRKTERLENRKKRITEFLSTYGDAIGQLKNDDRVTILLRSPKFNTTSPSVFRMPSPKLDYRVINTDSTDADTLHVEKRVYRTPSRQHQIDIEQTVRGAHGQTHNNTRTHFQIGDSFQARFQIGYNGTLFETTVTKRDIDAFSRGKIDVQTFQNRITFREHEPNSARDKKIDIMADILSSALKQDSDLHILGHTQSAGIYQKEVGAIFLLSHHTTRTWTNDENENDSLDALKTTIVETLADYGATLRDLSPNESIIVYANLKGDGDLEYIVRIVRINRKDKTTDISESSNRPNRLLFRVSKRDVDAYANDKMNLEAFRKKVEIIEM